MENDDEIVVKNSALYFHLLDNGFNDFEVTEAVKKNYSDIVSDEHIINDSEVEISAEDYKYFEKLVDTILESSLVFSDDIAAVKNFTTHCSEGCSVLKSSYFKLFYQTSASSVICLLCSFYAFKNRPLIYISLNLAPPVLCLVQCLNLFYTNYKERKILEDMIRIMKDFTLMLQKCIQFIQESEILDYNSISQNKIKLSLVGQSENPIAKKQVMFHLRSTTYDTLLSIILNLKATVITLVQTFPLKPPVDELNFYLAFLSEDDLHCAKEKPELISIDHLQKMKYVCLLLQSEFLKRLCLSLKPSLWKHRLPIRNVFAMIGSLRNIYNHEYIQIKEIFITYYTFDKPKDSKIPLHADWIYKEAYTKVCSVSLNLQSVLKNSRQIEEFLETVRIEDDNYSLVISKLDDFSENLVKNYINSKGALEDFREYVLRLKSKNSPKNNLQIPAQIIPESDVTNKTTIFVGASDFRPPRPDEVFIGVSTQDPKPEQENLDDDYIVANKCSKLLISELKLALQDKAQERKEREKIALQNKNLEDSLSEDEMPVEVMDKKGNPSKKYLNLSDNSKGSGDGKFLSDSSDEDEDAAERRKMIFPVGTTFAQKIAQASSHWALKTDDYIQSDDDETSDGCAQ